MASQFPAPYLETLLFFSAEKIKGWYACLKQNNAMDIYVKTQIVDKAFYMIRADLLCVKSTHVYHHFNFYSSLSFNKASECIKLEKIDSCSYKKDLRI